MNVYSGDNNVGTENFRISDLLHVRYSHKKLEDGLNRNQQFLEQLLRLLMTSHTVIAGVTAAMIANI